MRPSVRPRAVVGPGRGQDARPAPPLLWPCSDNVATPVLSATTKIKALDAERTHRAQSAGRAARDHLAAMRFKFASIWCPRGKGVLLRINSGDNAFDSRCLRPYFLIEFARPSVLAASCQEKA